MAESKTKPHIRFLCPECGSEAYTTSGKRVTCEGTEDESGITECDSSWKLSDHTPWVLVRRFVSKLDYDFFREKQEPSSG